MVVLVPIIKIIYVAAKGNDMQHRTGNQQKGFTLIEMMLVAAVIGMLFVMFVGYTEQRTRTLTIDRASQQMQQILNGALSYYIANGAWPTTIADLQAPTSYVPSNIKSPWATTYTAIPVPPVAPSTVSVLFEVYVDLPAGLKGADAIGATLAGKIPYGNSTTGSTPTRVTAMVNLPGQNVNNATAVNFAGLYHNGACVPMPSCPQYDGSGNSMQPEVVIVPVSISGANDPGTTNVYPITSFTAYASGVPSANPASCPGGAGDAACTASTSSTGKFWRACVQVVTSKGTVTWDAITAPKTAQLPVLMAMTRCAVQNEPSGDPFSVFGP